MLYHGIDIIEVERIGRAVERWGARFMRRVYTPGELRDCGVEAGAPRLPSLAARWAAKEAAAKALGVGLRGLGAYDEGLGRLGLLEIELLRAADGRPRLALSGAAAARAAALGLGELTISISHTRDYAVASVIGMVQ